MRNLFITIVHICFALVYFQMCRMTFVIMPMMVMVMMMKTPCWREGVECLRLERVTACGHSDPFACHDNYDDDGDDFDYFA